MTDKQAPRGRKHARLESSPGGIDLPAMLTDAERASAEAFAAFVKRRKSRRAPMEEDRGRRPRRESLEFGE